jgi:hypothetical protein
MSDKIIWEGWGSTFERVTHKYHRDNKRRIQTQQQGKTSHIEKKGGG